MVDQVTALNVHFEGDSSGLVREARRAEDATQDFGDELKKGERHTRRWEQRQRSATRSTRAWGRELRTTTAGIRVARSALAGFTGAIAAVGVSLGTAAFVQTAVDTDRLRASLKTVTGSTEEASRQFDRLVELGGTLPFTIDQTIEAFIRMKALGLDPLNDLSCKIS